MKVKLAMQLGWLLAILALWWTLTPVAARHGVVVLAAFHFLCCIAALVQVIYIEFTRHAWRTLNNDLDQLVNEASDIGEDILRDPRDNDPYERIHPPRPPAV